MGCCRFCFILLPLFLTLVALVLSALACAGSLKNNSFLTDIYYIDLDTSNLNVTLILSSADLSSSLTSYIDSYSDSTSINQALGLSDVYVFGMWGYCKGNLKSGESLADYNTDNVDFTYCSKAKAMYVFDPATVLLNDMTDADISDSDLSDLISLISDAGISLPNGVEDYQKVVKVLSKLIFICTIIGIALTFINLVFSIFAVCSHFVSCCIFIFNVVAFVLLTLGCAASSGAFIYLRKEFNNAVSDYGISAHLSSNYLVFYWVAVVLSLGACVFWMLSICCCSTGRSRAVAPPPPMEYSEKL